MQIFFRETGKMLWRFTSHYDENRFTTILQLGLGLHKWERINYHPKGVENAAGRMSYRLSMKGWW